MSNEFFKVPKKEREVVLWVHPAGRVLGSVFVREQSQHHIGEELPVELLNQPEPFVVVYRADLQEYRFYNKSSIVRIEFEQAQMDMESDQLACELHMMDGSLMQGTIYVMFPPDKSRLYDYLNKQNDSFIPLYTSDSKQCLINKNYIIYARSL